MRFMCDKEVRTIAIVVSDSTYTTYPVGGGGGGSTYTINYSTTTGIYQHSSKEYRLRGRWFDLLKQPDGTYTALVYATDEDTELVGMFPRALRAYFADALAEADQ